MILNSYSTKLTPAKNAKQIIKDIKILSNVVDCKAVQIKVVQPGYGNMNNIEVADNIPLVDPEYHDELMVSSCRARSFHRATWMP